VPGCGQVQDDAVEAARIRIDLAGTLYHSGRGGRSAALLEEAIRGAAAAGREDLVHVARTNRVELAIDAGQWDAAAAEIELAVEDARQRRDDRRLLVALHQRGRLLLRRGAFAAASRDNQDAREIAARLCDRVETGELWLEHGDLCVHAGDFDEARVAYRTAADHPPDRCDSDIRARRRISELAWREGGRVPSESLEELTELFSRAELAAAELGARWIRIVGRRALPPELVSRIERTLRAWGAGTLADEVFGRTREEATEPATALRVIRAAVSEALAGQIVEADLAGAGLTRLAVTDGEGREIVAVGPVVPDGVGCSRRTLEAGRGAYELKLWPPPAPALESSLAWTVETLLYRPAPQPPARGFEEGWRKLGVVTADASMEEAYRRLVRFAAQPVTVLVSGESGTGKEAVARAVHALSPRAAGPFLPVNVPAIPAALLESELFGHVKGAFTGADRDRPGLLEAAAGGTIFFDEIADLAPALQSKLLRALQDREIRRVGENRTRRIDVRVVSATSRDLAREVEAGRFREDLFYRLNVALVVLPPLRERGNDARLLARHFLAHYAREYGRPELQWETDALSAIGAHGWPGNVRELQNAVAQAAALADEDGRVRRAHLPEAIRRERSAAPAQNYRARLAAHRRGLITDALQRAGGNRTRAARELGLSRQALAYLIRELRLAPRVEH
jgi:DNA-binding NtrC family response regulator